MDSARKKILFLFVTFALFVVSVTLLVWRISAWSEHGWTGLEIKQAQAKLNAASPAYIVTGVVTHGPAHEVGVPTGYDVVSINNIPVQETERMEDLTDKSKIGDTLHYTIKTETRDLSYAVRVDSPLNVTHVLLSEIIGISVAFIFLLLGIFVYWKRAEDRRTIVFAMMAVSASAYFFVDSIMQIDEENMLGFVTLGEESLFKAALDSVVLIVEFLPILFLLHLSLIFPKERPLVRQQPEIFRWMYWFPLLLIPTPKLFLGLPTFPEEFSKLIQPVALLVFQPMLIFIVALYPISTCVALVRSYRESGIEEKRQVKWPLWGSTIAVAGFFGIPFTVALVQGMTGEHISYWLFDEILPKIFFLLIPISFSFAILKYRLMEIDLIIKRTIAYSLLSGIVVAVYFSIVAGLGVLLVRFVEVKSEWITIGSALLISTMIVPVKNRVQGFVDKMFFREKFDYPQALRMIGREISDATNLHTLLMLVAEELAQVVQNRAVVIFTKSSYEETFTATAKVGVGDDVVGRVKFSSGSMVVAEMGDGIEIQKQHFPENEKNALRKIHSSYILPITLKGDVIGFLSMGKKLSEGDFNDEDKEFLSSVAVQLAVGINNLQLVKQEMEYEEAREIQQGLLPKELPNIAGCSIARTWIPSRIVGGDYYDVLKFSETKLAICIGDVSGKGMPAALLMSNLQASVKAFASASLSPKELCGKINRVISTSITEGKFITFFFGIIDVEGKKLYYSNAGHNPPMLVRKNKSFHQLDVGGVVLGVFRDYEYEQGEIELNNGDKILLFTDGVTEAANASEDQFGEERLKRILLERWMDGVEDIQKIVLERITEFSQGDFQDDITLMVVEVV